MTRPFRAGQKQQPDADEASLRILQSYTVVAAMHDSEKTDQLVHESVSLSSKVAKSNSQGGTRVAALVFANAAEIQSTKGNDKAALKLYKRADDLFDKVGDASSEYSTMLDSYADALDKSNKQDLAMQKAAKAKKVESQPKDIIE